MSESESTSESSRGFPFRAVLAVSDGVLALACLLALGTIAFLLPSLKQLNISSNLAPFMNAFALTYALLIPTISFAAAAIMLPQKAALSRVGAKIGALSDALMFLAATAIFWLILESPYVPVLPDVVIAAFVFYAIVSMLLFAAHLWCIATIREHAARERAIGHVLLLVSAILDIVIVFVFISQHWGAPDGLSFTDFGQQWLPAIALHVLYDSDGLSLGYLFQILVLLISAVLLISGSRQNALMGCIGAIASYMSILVPLALTLLEALQYDPFQSDQTQPPPYIGIDAEFIVQASVVTVCLLVPHIIVLVRNLNPSKATQRKEEHSRSARWERTFTARLKKLKESAKKMHAGTLLGSVVSGVVGFGLIGLGLTREYVLVLGSAVLPTMPFFVGLLFLAICIILFVMTCHRLTSKQEQQRPMLGIRWAIITPIVVLGCLFVFLYIDSAPVMTRISSSNPTKERTVALGYPRFPHHTHADIYLLDPYSIIAHRTDTIIDYEKNLERYM